MRIGFSGSGGTGKTTTLLEVNKILEYPVIEEGVREYLQKNNIKHFRELSPEDIFKMQLWLLEQKEISESKKNFIADRTTIDNFVYALYWLNREEAFQRPLQHYMIRCLDHAIKSYDLIIVFPFGAIPLEDDGIRSSKEMYQFHIQLLIERMLEQVGTNIYPLQSITLKERTEEILDLIKRMEGQRITNELNRGELNENK